MPCSDCEGFSKGKDEQKERGMRDGGRSEEESSLKIGKGSQDSLCFLSFQF